MTTVSLIYAYWPNQPGGITWCDLPWALRDAGLPKRLSEAGHEVVETMLMPEDTIEPDSLTSGLGIALEIGDDVAEAQEKGELPIVLCGSCSLAAIGAVNGLGGADGGTGVAWFDAHPDLNTPETTTSGLFEGMALAAATGHAWRAMVAHHAGLNSPASLERAVLIGARDIDEAERELMAGADIPVTLEAREIADRLEGCRNVYAHLDMDVHDALAVRVNSFAAEGGPSIERVRALLTSIDNLACLSITGLDPQAPDGRRAADVAIEHVLAVAEGWAGQRQ